MSVLLISPWPTLLPAALAGTRRQPFAPLPGLTPALGGEADADAKQLLLTAANLTLVQRAGYQPPTAGAERLGPVRETLPVAGPAAAALLEHWVGAYQPLQFEVVTQFMRLLQLHQRRAPRHTLRPLLDYLQQSEIAPFLLGPYPDGLGRWGQQLARHYRGVLLRKTAQQLTADWQPALAAEKQPSALWRLARRGFHPAGLSQLLAQLPLTLPPYRRYTPSEGLAWQVLRQWTADGPLPSEAGPLLDPVVQVTATQFGQARSPRYLPQATLRAAMPGSDLPARCWQQAQPGLVLEAAASGLPRLRVALLPDWQPTSLLVAQLSKNLPPHDWLPPYCREQSNTELAELLALIPPSWWARAWHLTFDEAVAVAAAAEEGELVLGAWLQAAGTFQDAEFVTALARHCRALPTRYSPHGHDLSASPGGFSAQLPGFLQVVWFANRLPELPLTFPPDAPDRATPAWLREVGGALAQPQPVLLRALLPFLRAVLSQPPSASSLVTDAENSIAWWWLEAYVKSPDLTILPALEAALASGQPRFAARLASVLAALRACCAFEAALLAPPNPAR